MNLPPITLPARKLRRPPLLLMDLVTHGRDRSKLPSGFLPAFVGGDQGFVGGWEGPKSDIDPGRARAIAATYQPGDIVLLDAESEAWDTRASVVGGAAAEQAKRKVRLWCQSMRAGKVRVGLYGWPRGAYWPALRKMQADDAVAKWRRGEALTEDERWAASHHYRWDGKRYVADATIRDKDGAAAYYAWKADNDADTRGRYANGRVNGSAGIVQAVDLVAPSVSAFYRNAVAGLVASTRESIAEARRLAGGRLVLPVAWPVYHEHGDAPGETIALDVWRAQMREILETADGVICWGVDLSRHAEHLAIVREEAWG